MRQMDLTEGVIWKKLLVYAWPVVLSSLLQSAYAITDLIVAGWFIGKDGISAINNASQVMQILTQVILGITTGGNILMGQYFGAKDRDNRLKTNTTIFGFAILAGLIMTGVIYFLSRPILVGLKAPTLDEATAYLQICALGIIPIFGYNALSAMLRSVGNSRQPFYCVAVTAVCNIVLDCLFMGTFQWGVRGAALATMLAQLASFVVCLAYVLKHKDLFGLARKALRMHRDKLEQMLKLGIPCAVQMTVVGLSWLAMTFLINQYGVEASAASGICAKIKDVALLCTLALYTAATTMVAQCLGAKKFDRASRVVHVAMRQLHGLQRPAPGRGQHHVCSRLQPAQLHRGPRDPGAHPEPLLRPGRHLLGLCYRPGLVRPPGVPLRAVGRLEEEPGPRKLSASTVPRIFHGICMNFMRIFS